MQNFVILTKCAKILRLCFMTPMLVSHVFVTPTCLCPVCLLPYVCPPGFMTSHVFVTPMFSSLFIGLPLVSSHVSLVCLFLCVNWWVYILHLFRRGKRKVFLQNFFANRFVFFLSPALFPSLPTCPVYWSYHRALSWNQTIFFCKTNFATCDYC